MYQLRFAILSGLLLLLFSSGGLADGGGISQNATVQAFSDAGFQVSPGEVGTFDVLDMYNAGLITSCWGNNPTNPYLTLYLPKAPGQTTNNTMTDAPINPAHKGLWADYRLRPDEAVVFIGTTPPECDYFSYTAYIGMRFDPATKKPYRIFGSLGDSINLQRLAKEERYAAGAFNQPIVIIISADARAVNNVKEALSHAGYPDDIIHTLTIPHTLVTMGLDAGADTFTFAHRTANFKDSHDENNYTNSSPGTVYRLTPADLSEPDYLPIPDLIARGTGDTREFELFDDLKELREAILKKYGKDRGQDLNPSIWVYDGYDGIQRDSDMIADSRDAVYIRTVNTTLGNKPDDCIIVYGVNHVATGKATYSNFAYYGADVLNGIGAVSNHDYSGTAEEYLPGNPDAKYLYVAKISRNADNSTATLVVPYNQGIQGVDLDKPGFVGFRFYVEPETTIGDAWTEVVYDRAISFTS
jgi:hypothetical protein